MIVHIASDEKFINSAYWQFNEIQKDSNVFYILVMDPSKDLQYVDVKDKMQIVSQDIQELKALGRSLGSVDLVCFHGLDYYSSIVLNNLPKTQKILWIVFGREIYNNPKVFKNSEIIGRDTLRTFLPNHDLGWMTLIKNRFRGFYYMLKNQTFSPNGEIVRAMKRADYCGILYKEEHFLIKKRLRTNIEYIKFSYYPIEKMIKHVDAFVEGSSILLGNSAHLTNNHLEAFEILKNLSIKNCTIICPLSYGNETYKDKIIQSGKELFKEQFEPLIDFMPLHDYNTYLKRCGIVIMNHYRQQAVGNVLVMLWMGAKVYLNEKNTLFHYLKRIKVHIYEVKEDLKPNNYDALKPLTRAQQIHNRECLMKEIQQDVLLKELKTAINTIKCP